MERGNMRDIVHTGDSGDARAGESGGRRRAQRGRGVTIDPSTRSDLTYHTGELSNNSISLLCAFEDSIMMQGSSGDPPAQCADCGADGPVWASLNRGVLICTDCCYIHRNLGRFISQIKSLKHSHWEPAQLELIKLLHRSGSNRIWEHALTQSQFINAVKKPVSGDPVFPTKEAFIKAKYIDQAYTIKRSKDEEPVNVEDLNRQLWSCVRAGHVDTTLRLLVLGADPNYSGDKQNTPLHVAAKEGQSLQVELLFIYGALPSSLNAAGNTPAQVARLENHIELSNRLEDLCYDVTNRLSWFLCKRKPEHINGQHFLIPDIVAKPCAGKVSLLKQVLSLANQHFEKLAQDVYDEVDRRETVMAWDALKQNESKHFVNEQCVAVFLPLNPSMPAVRNQMRQKLAKFPTRHFAQLVIDVLKEAKRRHLGLDDNLDFIDSARKLNASERVSDSRDYDDVAEYRNRSSGGTRTASSSLGIGGASRRRESGSLHSILEDREPPLPLDAVLELKERISELESDRDNLITDNHDLRKQLNILLLKSERNESDVAMMRQEIEMFHHSNMARRMPSPALPGTGSMTASTASVNNNGERKQSRTNVLGLHLSWPPVHTSTENIGVVDATSRKAPRAPMTSPLPGATRILPPSGRMSVDHTRDRVERIDDYGRGREGEGRDRMERSDGPRIDQIFPGSDFPDALIRKTESLTLAIKDMLADATRPAFADVSEKHSFIIASLVRGIIEQVPVGLPMAAQVDDSINKLHDATARLSAKCTVLRMHGYSRDVGPQDACDAAYEVAKAAKSLLMAVHD